MNQHPQRGRPPTEPIYKLRTRAWFIAVSQASGLKTFELEMMFASKDANGQSEGFVRTGIWSKYCKGIVSPKLHDFGPDKLSLVNRVDQQFPGTKRWFIMPFWRLLSRDPLEPSELKTIFFSLPEDIRRLFVIRNYKGKNIFWRLQRDPESLYQELASIGTLDATIGVLAMIKEAEMTQNQLQHLLGLSAWVKCAARLKQDPVLSALLDPINKYVKKRFADTVYFTPHEPPTPFRFGNDRVRHVWIEHDFDPPVDIPVESPFARHARMRNQK